LKVFFLISDLGNGGQERQLTYLVRGLTAKGIQVKIITWNANLEAFHTDTIHALGVALIPLAKGNENNVTRLFRLRKLLRKEKPEILQSFSFYLNAVSWLATIFTRIKAFGAIRSRLELKKINTPDWVFVLSCIFPFRFISNNRSYGEGRLGSFLRNFLKKRCAVIGNAMYFDDFAKTPPQENPNTLVTASVSRIDENKRLDLIIQVHQKLRIQGFNVIHLHAGDGDNNDKLLRLIRNNNLESTFRLVGIIENIPEFLAQADLFVHAADYEGSPNAVMEAMAMGLAVVSTDCGDTRYVLKNGKGGFVVPVGDLNGLYEKSALLLNDQDMRIDMGAYNLVESRDIFSIERMIEAYEKVYSIRGRKDYKRFCSGNPVPAHTEDIPLFL
jgi:glycosyltransferase involved in cell wall biosynthesis